MAKALRFQGVVRLETRFEFGKRDEIWSTVGRKYIPSVEFWKTGMGREIFKEIFSAQRYSEQPPSRPSNLSSEQYRCPISTKTMLVTIILQIPSVWMNPCPDVMGLEGTG